MASAEFESIFGRLRQILQKHAKGLVVAHDRPGHYCLEGPAGPAAVRAWGGSTRRRMIPVGSVEVKKVYVSYHLVSIYANPKLKEILSNELRARMQGKACFNFRKSDEALFAELEDITAKSIAVFRKAGFIADEKEQMGAAQDK